MERHILLSLRHFSRPACLAAALTASCLAATSASGQLAVGQSTIEPSPALPDAPSALIARSAGAPATPAPGDSSSLDDAVQQGAKPAAGAEQRGEPAPPQPKILPQQRRVFGVLPNYTSISGGTKPKPAGWKTDAGLAWKQSTDYTAFGFSVVTSAIAYGQDSHPSLDTVNGGNAPYWAYAWRGLVDKTDQVVQGTLFFPALLHQDTRYYAMGTGPIWKRTLHATDSVVIAHSYNGNPVFNVAGLAGKVGTQALSTTYYPAGSENFGVLAQKFTYACLRQAGFTILKEFSPDIAQHLHRHPKN